MIEKLIRIYAHLVENRMDNYAGLVWDPGNKRKLHEGDKVIIDL